MAIHSMSVLQKRVLTQIVKVLQDDMSKVEKGMAIGQLALFQSAQLETVVVNIPKSSLVLNSNNYTKYKNALKGMMGGVEEFILPATNGKEKSTVTVLTRFIERFRWDDHTRDIQVYMYEGVAKELLKITAGYTRMKESVMMETNNTYTQRLYEFICHWRDLPVKTMTVAEFRRWLKLEDVYPDTWKLIQKVIKPPQKELREISDVYFEFSTKKSGNTITHFNFIPKFAQTIDEETIELARKREWLTQALRIAFKFKDVHFAKIETRLVPANYKAIEEKLDYLNKYIIEAEKEARNGKRDRIGSVPDYVVTILVKEIPAIIAD